FHTLMRESMNTQRTSQSSQRRSSARRNRLIAAISAALRSGRLKPRRAILIWGLLPTVAIAIVWLRHASTVTAQGGNDSFRLTDEAQRQIRSLVLRQNLIWRVFSILSSCRSTLIPVM